MKSDSFLIAATLAFPSLFEEDENGKYSTQLANLSDAAVARLETQVLTLSSRMTISTGGAALSTPPPSSPSR